MAKQFKNKINHQYVNEVRPLVKLPYRQFESADRKEEMKTDSQTAADSAAESLERRAGVTNMR